MTRHRLLPRLSLIMLVATVSPGALATSILVNELDDELNEDGDCSLREAVESANTNPGSGVDECNAGSAGTDSITLLVGGTLSLNSELKIEEALTITGPGRDALTIEAGPDSRHFAINMAGSDEDFSIENLTLSGGDVPDTGGGSILAVKVGTLRLDNVRLSDNEADHLLDTSGGAIALLLQPGSDARLEIHDSILENNQAAYRGGAVHIGGVDTSSAVDTIDIQRSQFRRNITSSDGGAIHAVGVPTVVIEDSLFDTNKTSFDPLTGSEFGGALFWRVSESLSPLMLINRSTFTGNDSRSQGGAIALFGGIAAVTNSTFENNLERADGGEAISLHNAANLFLFNSTLTDNGFGNSADVAIDICDDCKLTATHSIIHARWDTSVDCGTNTSGVVTSNGHNLDNSGTCTAHATDLPSTDPELWPLGDYGDDATGIVIPTRVPRPDSILVDAGEATCTGVFGVTLDEDQRGRPRAVAGPGNSTTACDIGAVEFQPGDPVPRALTVSLAGDSTGNVVSDPAGINCPAQDCTAELPDASEVTLIASTGPSPGVLFAGWSGACSGTGDCVLTLDADKNVTATFNVATDDLFADRFEN